MAEILRTTNCIFHDGVFEIHCSSFARIKTCMYMRNQDACVDVAEPRKESHNAGAALARIPYSRRRQSTL